MEESKCKMETSNIVAQAEAEDEFIEMNKIESPVAGVKPGVNKADVKQSPNLETLLTRMTLEEKTNMEASSNTAVAFSKCLFQLSEKTILKGLPLFEKAIPKGNPTSESGKYETLFKAAERGDDISFLSLIAGTEFSEGETDFSKTPRRNDYGDSLIHVAAKKGLWSVVGLLLCWFNEDINCQGYRMRTPLHCAVAQGHPVLAEILVNFGAKVDPKDADGVTPLGLAAGKGYTHFVEILLKRGARPGEMEFYMAAENGRWDIVELMLEQEETFSPLWRSKEKDPLVVLACKAYQWGIVKRLLEKGAPASDCKRDSDSALVWASACGQADVVQLLLRHGAASQYGQMQWALLSATTADVVKAFAPVVPDLVRELGKKGLLFPGPLSE